MHYTWLPVGIAPEGVRAAAAGYRHVGLRALQSDEVAKAKRNWIQEERRKTLGDWVAFCLTCGHTQRYFLEYEDELPGECPTCGGTLRHRCPACGAPIPSAFAVTCEECDAPVRDPELFGTAIRRPGK